MQSANIGHNKVVILIRSRIMFQNSHNFYFGSFKHFFLDKNLLNFPILVLFS